MASPVMHLGLERPVVSPERATSAFELATHHLVTHGVVVGMTGSGKTGLSIVLVEEALRCGVPVLLIDIKGDLPNLFLNFPQLSPEQFAPWVDAEAAARAGKTEAQVAEELSTTWQKGLQGSGLSSTDVAALGARMAPRIITPGASFGEPLNVLSALERRSPLWDTDEEAAHDALAASVSLALRLSGLDGDMRTPEHVVLSTFAQKRLVAGATAGLSDLLNDVRSPPVSHIGALPYEDFLPAKNQKALAQALNTLLASPKLSTWLRGSPLDIGAWLRPSTTGDGKVPAVIVSVAHLDDEERALVLGVLLEEVIAYVRSLSGTSELRALLVFDEIFGFLPPHPSNPPTKKPLLGLLKQARAFGVGVLLATQNPMDVDYKALSNAGVWFVGRLQTDADRERVVEGLSGTGATQVIEPGALADVVKSLPKRTFVVRNVHRPDLCLVESRFCLSYLRGPLTRREIARLVETQRPSDASAEPPSSGSALPSVSQAPGRSEAAPKDIVSAPAAPPGFRVFHGYADGSSVTYRPYVVGSVLLRVKEAKLGLATETQATSVAPILPDGRVDWSRTTRVDPRTLESAPLSGSTYLPLPNALMTKKGAQSIERSFRDHVASTTAVDVDVHRELGLFRDQTESKEAFGARCRQASLDALVDERHELERKFTPKLAKLEERFSAASRTYQMTGQTLGQAPSEAGTLLMGVLVGRGVANSARRARQKAESGFSKAKDAVDKAQTMLAEAQAERQAAHAELVAQAERRALDVVTERLLAKRGDAEVLWMGIAWSGQ